MHGMIISCMCDFVSVCLCVCTLKGKRLELSTPILIDVQCMTCLDPEVKRSASYDYEVGYQHVYACQYNCLGFIVINVFIV